MAQTKNKKPENRRDFLYLMTGAFAATGVGTLSWPFINSLNPSDDVLALSSIEVDLSAIQEGQSLTVSWRGLPVFIRHRTAEEIQQAEQEDITKLPDPEEDKKRVQNPKWLVVVGVCTHLGCIPQGQKPTGKRGDFGGWFCPCHGSHYDTSGRVRKGPAPKNLEVPQYSFLTDTKIKIG